MVYLKNTRDEIIYRFAIELGPKFAPEFGSAFEPKSETEPKSESEPETESGETESGESEWPMEAEETVKHLELTPEDIEEMIENDPIHAAIDLQIHHLPQYKHYALPLLRALIGTRLPIQPGSSLYNEIEYITNLLSQEQSTKD